MTRVKICGLTRLEDVLIAVDAGADFLGFILYDKSPRAVTFDQVAGFMEALRGYETSRLPLCVGVFVNPTADEVNTALQHTGLQAVQVHRTDLAHLRSLRQVAQGSVYVALQPRQLKEVAQVAAVETEVGAVPTAFWLPQLLIDAYHPDLAGGTGQPINLELAQQVTSTFPRVMLAGGLTPLNVADVVQAVHPWGVDVASGVEQAPGIKNHDKIRQFIQTVRQVDEDI